MSNDRNIPRTSRGLVETDRSGPAQSLKGKGPPWGAALNATCARRVRGQSVALSIGTTVAVDLSSCTKKTAGGGGLLSLVNPFVRSWGGRRVAFVVGLREEWGSRRGQAVL